MLNCGWIGAGDHRDEDLHADCIYSSSPGVGCLWHPFVGCRIRLCDELACRGTESVLPTSPRPGILPRHN